MISRLSVLEREEIARGLREGRSLRQIAHILGRAPSSVSREVSRCGGRRHYCASKAQRRCLRARSRPKPRKLERPALREAVIQGLRKRWSPQQISLRLRQGHPNDPQWWVSTETIYQALYVQGRGSLRKELKEALRTGRAKRRSQGSKPERGIRHMVMISERPPEVEDRAVPGHWEGDLIIGKARQSQIGTLVERSTRYVLLLHLPNDRSAETVRKAIAHKIRYLPRELKKSLTWDQGKELSEHTLLTMATGMPIYFCDPHSPWQRGSNENTNGLLRQYFPKGTDLSVHSARKLNAVACELNGRPRMTLDWKTPAEKMAELLR